MNMQYTFNSSFADKMLRFVTYKRMQGYDYVRQEACLNFFDRYLCSIECSADTLDIQLFTGYLETLSHLAPQSRQKRLSVVRQLSIYIHALNSESQIMPLHLLPFYERKIRFFRIAPSQVCDLMIATEKLYSKEDMRGPCMRFLIGLLYTTGMRISEAIHLKLRDIDLDQQSLFISSGKFGKDRQVAMETSTVKKLKSWQEIRSKYAEDSPSSLLFMLPANKALTYDQAYHGFRRLCEQCGLQGNPRPRLHDLRHNYACECLIRWRKEGKDVQALLPILSTAMGHVSPNETQNYIHISVMDLLEASQKFYVSSISGKEENQ